MCLKRTDPGCKGDRRGFTLLELLVVISIISVLMALLLPALKSARNAARSVKCLSQFQQIGVGFYVYAQDYRGQIASTYYFHDGVRGMWPELLGIYMNYGSNPREVRESLSAAFHEGRTPFACPSQEDKSGRARGYQSYARNCGFRGGYISTPYDPHFLHEFTMPTRTMLTIDFDETLPSGASVTLPLAMAYDNYRKHIDALHQGGTAVLFVDGHASNVGTQGDPFEALKPANIGRPFWVKAP